MKIIVDVMGADNSPDVMVKAAVRAVKELSAQIILVGDEKEINRVLSENKLSSADLQIVNANDVITMEDDPISVRKKPESSLAVCLNLLKNGEGDALVSAGNSGALLVGATLFVRCIKGVRRAAMAPVMPVKNGMLMIADSGANIECKPEMLEQFAVMGSVYMKNVLGINNPRVGLANNGAEETKGTDLYVETHKVLKENKNINFVGNVEGRGVPMGECDVLVCDGFTGNLILKTYEGAGKMFADEIKNMFKKNIISKIGALFVLGGIKDLKKRMDYKEIGGAVILGISKPVIKAHGSSDEKAFFSAIRQAVNFVSTDVISKISDEMGKEA
jgi:glycerol-3-phosphate acyltransferase PlsX